MRVRVVRAGALPGRVGCEDTATVMQIKLKTGGLLAEHLPPGAEGNRAVLEVADGATPETVMKLLDIPLDEQYLMSLNGEVVRRDARGTTVLGEGDELVIMPPLRAG